MNCFDMSGVAPLLVLVTIITSYITGTCHAKYAQGIIETRENWVFLERFCFLSVDGDLSFDFIFPIEYEGQSLLLYYDEETDQWPAVYKSGKTCREMTSPPHIKVNTHQSIELSRDNYWSGCNIINGTDEDTGESASNAGSKFIRCSGSRGFKSARERWWYMAFSRCSNDSLGLKAKYTMLMTNSPNKGDTFFRHFSADEFYILQTDIAFMVIMIIILIISVFIAVVLKGKQLFHTTYKMYMISLSLECCHLLFMVIAYAKYASDGLDNSKMKTFARILEAASVLMFLLMLIVMAKGYTITRGKLSTSGSIKIAIFMTIYTVVYASLFIYEANAFDPGLVLYIYESPAGYGLIGMRIVGWVWFCYAIFFTLKHYPEKSSFYYPFFFFFTVWFIAMPIMVIVSNSLIDKWVRSKIVSSVMNIISFFGHTFFLILTRPSAANSNFPYHVRTSQIGVMSGLSHTGAPVTANPTSDSFGMNSYAPEYYTTPNFQDLFGTSTDSSPTPLAKKANGINEDYPHKPANGQNPFTTST